MLADHDIRTNTMKLGTLASSIGGELSGDPDTEITGASSIAGARSGDITFLASQKFVHQLAASRAACIIVKDFLPDIAVPQLKVQNPHYAFAKALEIFNHPPPAVPGIQQPASIDRSAVLGEGVSVYPFVSVAGNVEIGDHSVLHSGVVVGAGSRIGKRCIIHPNVTIREGVTIGDRVIIHSGTVIGSDGFGYVFENGEHYKIPQVGGVVIGDDVEIGSNVSIDRATVGNTVIGKGTKIDNLVQIAHNVTIGEKSLIISQVGIAGSTEIGSFVILGGQVGVADHAKIDSGTMVGAQAGIAGHLEKGVYIGSPAIPHKTWMRAQAIFSRLPELQKRLRALEERLNTAEKGKQDAERD